MSDRPTFEQREAAFELPKQLDKTEISAQLRALVWNTLFHEIVAVDRADHHVLKGNSRPLMLRKHVMRDFRAVDDFDWRVHKIVEPLKQEVLTAEFPQFYGLIEWFLRNTPGVDLGKYLNNVLTMARAPYRVIDGDTLVPLGTDEELAAISSGVADAAKSGLNGATAHLKSAASAASDGRWADSIRESIHAVESVAVTLEPSAKELGPALSKLEAKGMLHGGLKNGFKAIYGYTSDEKGVRHALLDKASSEVDEADALFMIGACASFVSYLIAKGRAAGLVER